MTRLTVVQGDLTKQGVGAIVNAANEHLRHGGGVAAAIVRSGGTVIQTESDEWVRRHGPVPSGGAAVTGAGTLPADIVVHVVGPRYRSDQDNAALLTAAVRAALEAAAGHGVRSIAFPAISAGIFGYPRPEATAVIVAACRSWLSEHGSAFDEVRLVGFDDGTVEDFRSALEGGK